MGVGHNCEVIGQEMAVNHCVTPMAMSKDLCVKTS